MEHSVSVSVGKGIVFQSVEGGGKAAKVAEKCGRESGICGEGAARLNRRKNKLCLTSDLRCMGCPCVDMRYMPL